ncbi:hypothetical protein NL676_004970 [Syzygium grande]|nr:hypothetical protein NL676_004970 [Syzygium grande]
MAVLGGRPTGHGPSPSSAGGQAVVASVRAAGEAVASAGAAARICGEPSPRAMAARRGPRPEGEGPARASWPAASLRAAAARRRGMYGCLTGGRRGRQGGRSGWPCRIWRAANYAPAKHSEAAPRVTAALARPWQEPGCLRRRRGVTAVNLGPASAGAG